MASNQRHPPNTPFNTNSVAAKRHPLESDGGEGASEFCDFFAEGYEFREVLGAVFQGSSVVERVGGDGG